MDSAVPAGTWPCTRANVRLAEYTCTQLNGPAPTNATVGIKGIPKSWPHTIVPCERPLSAPPKHPLNTCQRPFTAINSNRHQCLHPSIMQQVDALTPGHRIALIVSVTVIGTVLLVFYATMRWILHRWSRESPPLWQPQPQRPPIPLQPPPRQRPTTHPIGPRLHPMERTVRHPGVPRTIVHSPSEMELLPLPRQGQTRSAT